MLIISNLIYAIFYVIYTKNGVKFTNNYHLEQDFRIQEHKIRIQEQDFRIQEQDFHHQEQDFRIQEQEFRILEQDFRWILVKRTVFLVN